MSLHSIILTHSPSGPYNSLSYLWQDKQERPTERPASIEEMAKVMEKAFPLFQSQTKTEV